MHVISLCLILILNNSVSFCLFDVNSPGKIKCLLRCSIFIPFCICEYKFLISILHDSLIMGHIKFGKNWTSNHKRLSQMVLGINVFTKIIEVFWVHTALSFEECLQHCLGWFYNWRRGRNLFEVKCCMNFCTSITWWRWLIHYSYSQTVT